MYKMFGGGSMDMFEKNIDGLLTEAIESFTFKDRAVMMQTSFYLLVKYFHEYGPLFLDKIKLDMEVNKLNNVIEMMTLDIALGKTPDINRIYQIVNLRKVELRYNLDLLTEIVGVCKKVYEEGETITSPIKLIKKMLISIANLESEKEDYCIKWINFKDQPTKLDRNTIEKALMNVDTSQLICVSYFIPNYIINALAINGMGQETAINENMKIIASIESLKEIKKNQIELILSSQLEGNSILN